MTLFIDNFRQAVDEFDKCMHDDRLDFIAKQVMAIKINAYLEENKEKLMGVEWNPVNSSLLDTISADCHLLLDASPQIALSILNICTIVNPHLLEMMSDIKDSDRVVFIKYIMPHLRLLTPDILKLFSAETFPLIDYFITNTPSKSQVDLTRLQAFVEVAKLFPLQKGYPSNFFKIPQKVVEFLQKLERPCPIDFQRLEFMIYFPEVLSMEKTPLEIVALINQFEKDEASSLEICKHIAQCNLKINEDRLRYLISKCPPICQEIVQSLLTYEDWLVDYQKIFQKPGIKMFKDNKPEDNKQFLSRNPFVKLIPDRIESLLPKLSESSLYELAYLFQMLTNLDHHKLLSQEAKTFLFEPGLLEEITLFRNGDLRPHMYGSLISIALDSKMLTRYLLLCSTDPLDKFKLIHLQLAKFESNTLADHNLLIVKENLSVPGIVNDRILYAKVLSTLHALYKKRYELGNSLIPLFDRLSPPRRTAQKRSQTQRRVVADKPNLSLINSNAMYLFSLLEMGRTVEMVDGSFDKLLLETFKKIIPLDYKNQASKIESTLLTHKDFTFVALYATRLNSKNDAHKELLLENYTKFLNSIVDGNFVEMRQSIKDNPHLKFLSEHFEPILKAFHDFEIESNEKDFSFKVNKEHNVPQKFKGLKIEYTNNPFHYLLCGTDLGASCLSINTASETARTCLMGYALNGNCRLIVITDDTGKLVARCVVRLLLNKDKTKLVLSQEPVYGTDPYFTILLNKKAKEMARELNIDFSSMEFNQNRDLVSLGGPALFEYSDIFGGTLFHGKIN